MLVPGNDRDRRSDTSGGDIVGYVWDVKVGGIETCNCGATDPARRDTHIELVVDPSNTAATDRVIVEVTPRWRQKMAAQGVARPMPDCDAPRPSPINPAPPCELLGNSSDRSLLGRTHSPAMVCVSCNCTDHCLRACCTDKDHYD